MRNMKICLVSFLGIVAFSQYAWALNPKCIRPSDREDSIYLYGNVKKISVETAESSNEFKRTKMVEASYNSTGYLINLTRFQADGTINSEANYLYDENDRLTKVNGSSLQSEIEYDESGNRKEIRYFNQGQPTLKKQYVYNDTNKIVAEDHYSGKDNEKSRHATYEYNNNGLQTVKSEWWGTNEIRTLCSYDDSGRLIEVNERSIKWKISYVGDNIQIERTGPPSVGPPKSIFIKNGKGLSISHSGFGGFFGGLTFKADFDKFGNRTRFFCDDYMCQYKLININYTYDNHGNWTEMVMSAPAQSQASKVLRTDYRTYEYYPPSTIREDFIIRKDKIDDDAIAINLPFLPF